MPWSRLRVSRPSDTALRRHSTLDPANIGSRGSQDMRNSHDGAMDSLNNLRSASPSPLRNSIDPARAANDASFGERPPSPPLPNARQQRFSILKFRHASDSQLSRTAKEHAQAAIAPPPMPNGKHLSLIHMLFHCPRHSHLKSMMALCPASLHALCALDVWNLDHTDLRRQFRLTVG